MKVDRILITAFVTGIVIGAIAVTLVDARRDAPLLSSLIAGLGR